MDTAETTRTLNPVTDIALPILCAVAGILLVTFNLSYVIGPFLAIAGLCGIAVAIESIFIKKA